MIRVLLVALIAMASSQCVPTPSPAPVPAPEAGVVLDSAPAADKCASLVCPHLASLGCAVGADPLCAATCERLETQQIVPWSEACIMAASSKSAARVCPGVECP